MSDPFDDDDDKPLDPAVARVQQRLRRLILISGVTLGLGIFAVFGAVVYRLMRVDGDVTSTGVRTIEPVGAAVPTLRLRDLDLDPSAQPAGLALDGDRLAMTFIDTDATTVIVIDLSTMVVVSRLRLLAD